MLYKEVPLLTVSIQEKGSSTALATRQVPISHLIEFSQLARGRAYEITVKSSKPIVDRRHEPSVTVTVEASPVEDTFIKAIVPLRGSANSSTSL